VKELLMIGLVAGMQLARADDEAKPSSKPASRPAPAAVAPANSSNTARAAQPVARRPATTYPSSPYVRPGASNATSIGDRRVIPFNRNRSFVPSATPANRTAVVAPNQQRNFTARTRPTRLPSRTGNELSFSQARQQCSQQQHHDRDWWRHHHSLIVFYGGGYWFWNSGWWFPALGYSPYYNNYIYDGPIYGSGALQPGDVTAQVQEALAQQGYYTGPLDGVLGPETRDAILRFQADHGLATTAAIDEPTLDSLGLT
jgi:Putative peptidoglycan binding domain